MKRVLSERRLWIATVFFAVGMAWVEAASVYYLRVLVDRVEPYQPNPLPIDDVLGPIELVREAATLVMLLTVGMLAARTWYKRLGYTAIAFGVWDIFYYVFLRIMSGWPRSLLDWDVLFLLPLPWWGPVLAPASIAALMIVWGTLATQFEDRAPVTSTTWKLWSVNWLGIALALYVFMADSIRAVSQGLNVMTMELPSEFNWPLFVVALVLMAVPIVEIGRRLRPGGPSVVAMDDGVKRTLRPASE
jgi:hypothetical protein